jgi:hypothetical protein
MSVTLANEGKLDNRRAYYMVFLRLATLTTFLLSFYTEAFGSRICLPWTCMNHIRFKNNCHEEVEVVIRVWERGTPDPFPSPPRWAVRGYWKIYPSAIVHVSDTDSRNFYFVAKSESFMWSGSYQPVGYPMKGWAVGVPMILVDMGPDWINYTQELTCN